MFHRATNIGKLYKPMSFHLHYNENGLTIKRQAFNVREFITKVTAGQQVLGVLKQGALKPEAIIAQIPKCQEGAIRTALSRLLKAKLLILIDGAYGLAAKKDQQVQEDEE